MARRWFDAHLDLAYLALNGRDMRVDPPSAGGPDPPAAATLTSLRAGRVERCLGTIFTEAGGPAHQAQSYPEGDWTRAHTCGRAQLDVYRQWRRAGHGAGIAVLIEGADPITDPGDLREWIDGGVVAIGMAWWKPSRYAGGNGTDLGLSDLGRALVASMDRAGLVHDASHLSDRAFWELLDATPARIVASHSNCRTLMGGGGRGQNQRHLHDDQIREIAKRGGVIGLNLYSKFLRSLADGDTMTRATIDDCVNHIEHVCNVAGSRTHVGLGSDMDGGFSAARLPMGIDAPRDLERLPEGLAARGWNDSDINGFAFDNWARVFPQRG